MSKQLTTTILRDLDTLVREIHALYESKFKIYESVENVNDYNQWKDKIATLSNNSFKIKRKDANKSVSLNQMFPTTRSITTRDQARFNVQNNLYLVVETYHITADNRSDIIQGIGCLF